MTDVAKLEKALAKLTQEGAETGKVLTAAEHLLGVKPNHAMALQCKAVCCMYNEKFGAAVAVLDALESSSNGIRLSPAAKANAKFQRAYCLYRMRRYAEAKAVLTSTADGTLKDHIPSRHLLAQVHYNLEEFTAAAAIYKALLDTEAYRDEEERVEVETNYTAVLASGKDPRQAVTTVQDAEDKTSDLVYNAATALIEAEDFAGAMKMLQQAETLYAQENPKSRVRSLKDGLALADEAARAATIGAAGTAERRFFNDAANTWVQMAFVKYATHDEAGAEAILTLVLDGKPSSAVTVAVASINWTAIRRSKDFVDASKKLKAVQNTKVASRLTSKQNLIVRYNAALLHLNSGNLASCKKLVDAMAKEHPESELTQSLRLAIAAREANGKKTGPHAGASSTEALVNEFMAKQSPASKRVALIAVQVYLENGDLARALEAFANPAIADVANQPAGVATRAAWLVQLGRVPEAVQLLEAAVPRAQGMETQRALLSWAVHFLATSDGDAGNAHSVALLRKVRTAVPALAADKAVSAMLGLSLTLSAGEDRQRNLAEARECLQAAAGAVSSSAPSATAMSAKEIAALEKKQPSRAAVEELGYHRRTADEAASTTAAGGPGEPEQRLRKRRPRPMRRPPRVAPVKGKAPDPERWIPMSMRSYIKDLPARKKKELKRLRALEQEQKRKAAEKRKAAAAAGIDEAAVPTAAAEVGEAGN